MAREDSTQNLDELLGQNILSEQAFRSRSLLREDGQKSTVPPMLPAEASLSKRSRGNPTHESFGIPSTAASAALPAFLSVESAEWGLPPGVAGALVSQGISHLHPWQAAALRLAAKQPTRNLVISAPTSGGKSLVADVLLLRALVARPGLKALIVLPYTALVQQKVAALSTLLGCINTAVPGNQPRVRALHGSKGSPRFGASTVLVTTPERALGVLARLAAAEHDPVVGNADSNTAGPALSDLAFVCIDEVHLVGDTHRGSNLETLLSLLVYCCRERTGQSAAAPCGISRAQQGRCRMQILGMSATLQNSRQIAEWLQAQHFKASARPTVLSLRSVLQGVISEATDSRHTTLDVLELPPATVGQGAFLWQSIVALLSRAWEARQNTIVFFPSKDKARACAERLCGTVQSQFPAWSAPQQLLDLSSKPCISSLSKPLRQAFRHGVGLHHAGLDAECRELMAAAFEGRVLHTLCCTSSLAAGVNLPADKVIVTSLKLGAASLDSTQLNQMVGRAGRFGMSETGEAFILTESVAARNHVLQMLLDGPVAVCSHLLPPLESQSTHSGGAIDKFLHTTTSAHPESVSVYWSQTACAPALALQRLILCGLGYGLAWDLLSLWDLLRCTLCARLNNWAAIMHCGLDSLSQLLREGHCIDLRFEGAVTQWREQVRQHLQRQLGQDPKVLAAEMGQVATDEWMEEVLQDFPPDDFVGLLERPLAEHVRLCCFDRQACLVPSEHGSAAANAVLTSSEASILTECCNAMLDGSPTAATLAGLLFCVPVRSCPVRIVSCDSLSSRILELHETDIALLHHFGLSPSSIMTLPQVAPSKVGVHAQRVHCALLLRQLLDGNPAELVLQQAGLTSDAMGQLQRLVAESVAFGASAKEFCSRVMDAKRSRALGKLIDTQRRQLKALNSGRYADLARRLGTCGPVAAALSRQGFKTVEDTGAAHPREMAFALLSESPWSWPRPPGQFVVPPKGQQRYSVGAGSARSDTIGDSPLVAGSTPASSAAAQGLDVFSQAMKATLDNSGWNTADSVDELLSGVTTSVLQQFPTTPHRAAAQRNALKTSRGIHSHLVAERSAWAQRIPSSTALLSKLAPVSPLDCTLAAERWLRETEAGVNSISMLQPASVMSITAGPDCSVVSRQHAADEGLPVNLEAAGDAGTLSVQDAVDDYESDSSACSGFSDASHSSVDSSRSWHSASSDDATSRGLSAPPKDNSSFTGPEAADSSSTRTSSRVIHSLLQSQYASGNRSSFLHLNRSLLSPQPVRLATSKTEQDSSNQTSLPGKETSQLTTQQLLSSGLALPQAASLQVASSSAGVSTTRQSFGTTLEINPLWPALLKAPLLSLQCISTNLPVFADATRWQWSMSPGWKVIGAAEHTAKFSPPGQTGSADCTPFGLSPQRSSMRIVSFGTSVIIKGVMISAWLSTGESAAHWLHLPPPVPRRIEWEAETMRIEKVVEEKSAELDRIQVPLVAALRIFDFLAFEVPCGAGQQGTGTLIPAASLGSCCRMLAAAHCSARTLWYHRTIPMRWKLFQNFVFGLEGRFVMEESGAQLRALQSLGVQIPGNKIVDPAHCSWILDPDENQRVAMHESAVDLFSSKQPSVLAAAIAETLGILQPSSGGLGSADMHLIHAKQWTACQGQAAVRQGSRAKRKTRVRGSAVAPPDALAAYHSTAFGLVSTTARKTWDLQHSVTLYIVHGRSDPLLPGPGTCGSFRSCWTAAAGSCCSELRGAEGVSVLPMNSGGSNGHTAHTQKEIWDIRDVTAQRGLSAVVCTAGLLSAISAGGMLDAVLEREMPLQNVLVRLELHGMAIDKRSCIQLHVELKETLAAIQAAANKLLPPSSSVDLQSFQSVSKTTAQLAQVSQCDTGHELKCLGFSTEVLRELQAAATGVAPAVQELMTAVLAQRQASSLLHQVQSLHSPAAWDALSSTFKLHPLSSVLSSTGRIAMSSPSLQMIPKDYEYPVAPNISVQAEMELGLLPPDALLVQSQSAAVSTNATASYKALQDVSTEAPSYAVMRACSVQSVGSAVSICKPALAGGGSAGPVQTAAGEFDFSRQPLVDYWRRHGFDYSEDTAKRVAQAVIRLGSVRAGVCVAVPADQVFRKLAARSFPLSPPISTPGADSWAQWDRPRHKRANLRSLLKASPGFVLLGADYSQVELRVLASLSRDTALCALLTEGSDVFRFVADKWQAMGLHDEPGAVLGRAAAKRLVYGMLYGMGDRQLAQSLSVSLGAAVRLRDGFLQLFPGVRKFLIRTVEQCRANGYVTTLAGRKRFLPTISSSNFRERLRAERQAVNTVCQGSAADILKLAMLKLHSALGLEQQDCWRAIQSPEEMQSVSVVPLATEQPMGGASTLPVFTGISFARTASQAGISPWVCPATQLQLPPQAVYAARLVCHIHDELILEVPENPHTVAAAQRMLRSCMQEAATLYVPLVVNMCLGGDWGGMQAC